MFRRGDCDFAARVSGSPCTPGASKSTDTRYLDIHEDDQLDEAQLAAWLAAVGTLTTERARTDPGWVTVRPRVRNGFEQAQGPDDRR
jgi:hypothetical protein